MMRSKALILSVFLQCARSSAAASKASASTGNVEACSAGEDACVGRGKSMMQTSSLFTSASSHKELGDPVLPIMHEASAQEAVAEERREAGEWLKIKFPSTSTKEAANYVTSLLKFDAWFAAGRYDTALFKGGKDSGSTHQVWPKIIHQTWKNKNLSRPIFEESRLSWKAAFPSWQYRLWTDDEMMPFMQDHYPEFADTFRMLPYTIMKIDAFRLFILHHYGGVYADLDFLALKNFESFLETLPNKEVVVGKMNEKADGNGIPNAFMVSKPGARLWEYLHGLLPVYLHTGCLRFGHDKISAQHAYWKNLESRIDRLSQALVGTVNGACWAEGVTGPAFLTTAIKNSNFNNQSVEVVDGVKFYPIDWSTEEGQKHRYDFHVMSPELVLKNLQERFPDSMTATIWTHSWGHDKST